MFPLFISRLNRLPWQLNLKTKKLKRDEVTSSSLSVHIIFSRPAPRGSANFSCHLQKITLQPPANHPLRAPASTRTWELNWSVFLRLFNYANRLPHSAVSSAHLCQIVGHHITYRWVEATKVESEAESESRVPAIFFRYFVFLHLPKGKFNQSWNVTHLILSVMLMAALVTFYSPHSHSWVSQRWGIPTNRNLLWPSTKVWTNQ